MKLQDWIIAENLTQTAAAKRLRVSQATINYLVKGRRFPSLRLMQRITVISDGAVTLEDFVSD